MPTPPISKDPNKTDALNVLFPEIVIPLNEENTEFVTVRPLSLLQLPKVSQAFSRLMKITEHGAGPAEIAALGMEEILVLLPHCIDRPADQVPASAAPEIVEAVIKQNMTEASIKKWTALVDKVIGLGEKAGATIPKKATSPNS